MKLFLISECKGGVSRYLIDLNKYFQSYIYIPPDNISLNRLFRGFLITWFILCSLLKFRREDKLIFYFNSSIAGIFGRIALIPFFFLKNIYVLYSPHGWSFYYSKPFYLVEKFLFYFTHHIILSDSSEKKSAKFLSDNKTSVINNCVLNDFIHSDKIYDFIFIGRNCKQKGINFLLDILDNPSNNKYNFLICTDDKFTNNSYTNASFIYSANEEELIKYISKSYIILSCSLYEGFPYVFLDALSQGVPILLPKHLNFDHLAEYYNFMYYENSDLTFPTSFIKSNYLSFSENSHETYLSFFKSPMNIDKFKLLLNR